MPKKERRIDPPVTTEVKYQIYLDRKAGLSYKDVARKREVSEGVVGRSMHDIEEALGITDAAVVTIAQLHAAGQKPGEIAKVLEMRPGAIAVAIDGIPDVMDPAPLRAANASPKTPLNTALGPPLTPPLVSLREAGTGVGQGSAVDVPAPVGDNAHNKGEEQMGKKPPARGLRASSTPPAGAPPPQSNPPPKSGKSEQEPDGNPPPAKGLTNPAGNALAEEDATAEETKVILTQPSRQDLALIQKMGKIPQTKDLKKATQIRLIPQEFVMHWSSIWTEAIEYGMNKGWWPITTAPVTVLEVIIQLFFLDRNVLIPSQMELTDDQVEAIRAQIQAKTKLEGGAAADEPPPAPEQPYDQTQFREA